MMTAAAAILGASHCTGQVVPQGNPHGPSGGDGTSSSAAPALEGSGGTTAATGAGGGTSTGASASDASSGTSVAVSPPAPIDASTPVPVTSPSPDDSGLASTVFLDGSAATGPACNPYWWAPVTCSQGLTCCRRVGAPPYVQGEAGIETPGYTCESPADPSFVCVGPGNEQPCDTSTASNDPLFCARGLSCCDHGGSGPFTCHASQGGDTCVL